MPPLVSLVLLALALAADAFAVALAQGAVAGPRPWRHSLAVGGAFGVAQAVAPLTGWALGTAFAGMIESIDHWIAFVLLSFVGGKMIFEGLKSDPPGEEPDPVTGRPASGFALFALAVATSIDAAAAGFTLPALGFGMALSVSLIGVITFVLSASGVWIGRFASQKLGSRAELLGGVVLMGIGIKVLFDHRAFG